ncbi:acyltransferase [Paractinoplanes ferrugineus]|uniref:Acyltransferase n=1 Tax=Paractinoplanes ferrugineus TaxID=113564 RepID=A0A919J8T0_9ACTN|nr:acyltransferase [Actinoplanes ferrugineus]GIE16223.1 acyltransferase [Actinoplanes ferrugineus]
MDSLTGMRFAAALMVFAFHFTLFSYLSGGVGKVTEFVFAKGGTAGVSFFFILSGFVLTWSAREADTALRFWRRRLVKIYPNHVATFLFAALIITMSGTAIAAGPAVANLFLIQPWFPGKLGYATSMNPLSWSIACEAFFYLLFPFLLRALRRIPEARLWPAAGLLAVVTTSVPFISYFLVSDAPSTVTLPGQPEGLPPTQLWFVYFFPLARLLDFVLGMLAARIVIAHRWPRTGMLPAAGIFLAGYAAALFTPFYLITVSGVIGFFCVPLIAAASQADRAGRGTVFSGRRWVWLGETSFAFYMVHGLLLAFGWGISVEISGTEDWPVGVGLLLGAVMFTVILLAARGLYRSVERPFVRRFSSPRRPNAAGGAEPVAVDQRKLAN